MKRLFYVDYKAGPGDTFGVFVDPVVAESTLRKAGRSLATHTIRKTEVGYIVTDTGYDKGATL